MKRAKTQTPSFVPFRPVSESSSLAKRRTRSKDTKAEMLLRRGLSSRGLRYRLHCSDLPGKPDVVFRMFKLAVFCDGDFWHGRAWAMRRSRLKAGANAAYWVKKIEYNIERDKQVTRQLRSDGWLVLRFWESDIVRKPGRIAAVICRHVGGTRAARETVELSRRTAHD